MNEWRRHLVPATLILAGLTLIGLYLAFGRESPGGGRVDAIRQTEPPSPSRSPEPVLPTRTETAVYAPVSLTPRPIKPSSSREALDGPALTLAPAAGETKASPNAGNPFSTGLESMATKEALEAEPAIVYGSPKPAETATIQALAGLATPTSGIPRRARFGTSGSLGDMNLAIAWGLPFGSFFNWNISRSPFSVNGVEFWQTVRVTQDGVLPTREQIGEAIASNPGSVWIIGNEPDVVWQDNVTAERYAILYEEMYRFIKTLDSTARVAVGGVAMPTPLRREYLNRALESYRISFGHAMPVDVWTVHAYILREQSGSWGVEIPPGMDVSSGQLYEIADHGNLEIFRQNLIDFRAWMFSNGYGDRPLAVTEFGVLMPPDYGYPDEAKISFMNGAMDFMGSASNGTGYPADGGRLVQWWFWYSLYDTPDRYPAGNLIDHERNGLTALGQAWAAYVLGG